MIMTNRFDSGLYLSEDKKGLIVDIFVSTGIVRGLVEDSEVADALYKVLSENASNEIECLIISNNEGVGFDYYDIRLDASRLRAIFPKLHTVVRCDDVKIENTDNEGIRLINHDYLDTCSFEAYEKKDFEKALYYGEFSTLTDYYWGNYSFGRLLYDLGKEEEAEKYLKRVAESKYIAGDGNFLYGHLLDKQGRYKEALKYLRLAMRPISDTAPREEAMCVICDSLRKYKENCPYWPLFDQKMFKKFSKYYLETCDPENGKAHLEKIITMREKK
jgi:tetratricopeptide (TPR) repeat protein